MRRMIAHLKARLSIEPRRLALYLALYGVVGVVFNEIGTVAEIARFRTPWQIVTVYLCYLVPVSLYVRRRAVFDQYLYGLFFLALLEFGGYALESSYAYPDNVLDRLFGVRNFALFMAIAFGLIPPVGNILAGRIGDLLFGKEQ